MFDIKIVSNTGEVVELDQVCYTCLGGECVLPEVNLNSEGMCFTCNGKGRLLTGNGLMLIEFLKRYKDIL